MTSGTRVRAGSQGMSVAVISPKVTAARPNDASTTPGTSSGRGSEVAAARGTVSQIKTTVTTMIGRLTQKIVDQPDAVSSRPPTIGPAPKPMPPIAAHQPIA